jgi:hypothetical protein
MAVSVSDICENTKVKHYLSHHTCPIIEFQIFSRFFMMDIFSILIEMNLTFLACQGDVSVGELRDCERVLPGRDPANSSAACHHRRSSAKVQVAANSGKINVMVVFDREFGIYLTDTKSQKQDYIFLFTLHVLCMFFFNELVGIKMKLCNN